jgi:hypothetical protein
MEEWAANPQWWLSNTVAAVLALLLPHTFRRSRSHIQLLLSRAHGWTKPIYRAWRCKRLKKIKAIRFDSLRISRQIALSYACLILFIGSAIASVAGFVLIPVTLPRSQQEALILTFMVSGPALFFEIAWLVVAGRLDDVMKSRKRIRRQRLGLY